MTFEEQRNVALVREYLSALQAGETGEALRRFFTEDVLQIELPNRLNPKGQESDLIGMLERSVRGSKVLLRQTYEIVSEVAQGNRVAVEAVWTGVLTVPFGSLPAGQEMKAHFAIFFQFHDGKIQLQRNYDCFLPW